MGVALMAIGVWAALQYLGTTESKLRLLEHVVILAALGAVIYAATNLLLWLAMKRPQGPETEVQRLLGKILSKARSLALPRSA